MEPSKQRPSKEDTNPQRVLVRWLLNSIRNYQHHKQHHSPIALVMRRLTRIQYEVLSILTGADVGITAKFGTNFRLPHPNGVVVHERAMIGDDCMFMQQVTIGILADHRVPVIGSRVYIGAGAKVLGHVHVGDDARIGANAVVLSDVPAGATVVGIPARVVVRQPQDVTERIKT